MGSGKTELTVLLHEGGHAAHFANILQHSPFFGQVGAVLLHEGGHTAHYANILQHSPFFGQVGAVLLH